MRARLRSYLSDNGVRLKKGTTLVPERMVEEQLCKSKEWSSRHWQVIEGMLMELRHAEEQRQHWRSLNRPGSDRRSAASFPGQALRRT